MTTKVKVAHIRKEICGWPTDTYEIDTYNNNHVSSSLFEHDPLLPVNPHTVLMFVPGNPGCAGWYIKMLKRVIEHLGDGYAARAVSYAGHGAVPDVVQEEPEVGRKEREKRIAWTLDGQLQHKISWCHQVMEEFMTRHHGSHTMSLSKPLLPKIVWISHSIGCYLVERQLVLCKQTLLQTQAVIHLMPFRRFDPNPKWKKIYLSSLASIPKVTPAVLQVCSTIAKVLPNKIVDLYLEKVAGMSVLEDRELARGLLCNPTYAKNFITLGMEEIRDVPEKSDNAALNIIGKICPMFILYCGRPDQWAPKNHMDDLNKDISHGKLPNNNALIMEYNDDLIHSFIVYPHMVEPVVTFICNSVSKSCQGHHENDTSFTSPPLQSRL
mmetsp:Transcript_13628/g.25598  ORF Transcript_13628/g.25598 Transcript_13628/m.25598 type:complete len:381 (-) Transcript_13628:5328-6470(-)